MSAWLRKYYNGAALSGGFAFPAGYDAGDPGNSDLAVIGQNVWNSISGKLSASKLASMALTEQKLGSTDLFYEVLGYLACMDSTGLQIDQNKAIANKMKAKYKAGKATQADNAAYNTAMAKIAALRASLDDLDQFIDNPQRPAETAVKKAALSKMKKILHPPTRINKIQRAYLMSTTDPYGPNTALRFVSTPRSSSQIATMMNRLKDSKSKIVDGMWNYKLLRDQIRGKKATYRSTPWTATVPQGIIRPPGYMGGLTSMIDRAVAAAAAAAAAAPQSPIPGTPPSVPGTPASVPGTPASAIGSPAGPTQMLNTAATTVPDTPML